MIIRTRRLPDYKINAYRYEYGNALMEDRWKIRLFSKYGRTYFRTWYSIDCRIFNQLKGTHRIALDPSYANEYNPDNHWIQLFDCACNPFQLQKSCYSTIDRNMFMQLMEARCYDEESDRNSTKVKTLAYLWLEDEKVISRVIYK